MTCNACSENLIFDFRDTNLLRQFLTAQFKIKPSKYTGLCKKHQKKLSGAIKKRQIYGIISLHEKATQCK